MEKDIGFNVHEAKIILKKREEWVNRNAHQATHNKKQTKLAAKRYRTQLIKTANYFAKNALTRVRALKRCHQVDTSNKLPKCVPNTQCLLVIRSRQVYKPTRSMQKELETLRLKNWWTGIFLRNGHEQVTLLRKLDQSVLYGGISTETMRKLLSTRAYVRAGKTEESSSGDGQIVPLSTNILIEEVFSDEGCLCVEDLVSELMIGGKHLETISAKLQPFKFDSIEMAEGPPKQKRHGLIDNMDELITMVL